MYSFSRHQHRWNGLGLPAVARVYLQWRRVRLVGILQTSGKRGILPFFSYIRIVAQTRGLAGGSLISLSKAELSVVVFSHLLATSYSLMSVFPHFSRYRHLSIILRLRASATPSVSKIQCKFETTFFPNRLLNRGRTKTDNLSKTLSPMALCKGHSDTHPP